MSVLRHAFEEAAASLWRGRRLAGLATVTIATAVFVLGCVLFATTNLEQLAAEWQNAAELSVFLTDEVGADDRRRIEGLLAPGPIVRGFEYVSKADALVRFKQMFGDMAPTIDALGGNPLPASYEVRLAGSGSADLDALATRLRASPGVSDVRYDRQWLDRLFAAVAVIRRIGTVLSGLLALAAALTATTVIRLALHARRDELEIMELVGSPTAYVEGPFVMEGALQGLLGGLVAIAALYAAFYGLRPQYLAPWAAAVNLSSVRMLTPASMAWLVLGATGVGALSGLAAARWRR